MPIMIGTLRLLALAFCAIYLQPCLGSNPGRLPRISIEDGRFVDNLGRERHFRGVNVVYKDPPWYPALSEFHSNLSFTSQDAELLKSFGVNLIRLGVMWPGVVPEEGVVDQHYLEAIEGIVNMAASRGMYTLLDPHQDEFNPRFCGEGAPDWWTIANTQVKDFPVPVQAAPFNMSPPKREMCLEHSSFSYIFTHDAAKAYQQLWKNPAAFADFWRVVAAYFRGNHAVLGAEIWNEPFPGDIYGNSSFRLNSIADHDNLQPFYEEIERSIHSPQGDPDLLVAYEPSWPVGDQDLHPQSLLPPRSGFTQLPGKSPLYAFHYYSAPCNPNISSYLDARLADASRLRAVPIATEFNLYAADRDSQETMARTFEAFESRLISYTGWQYKSYSGSLPNGTCTGCGNSFFQDEGTLNTYMTQAMARPFVQAVAGKLSSRSFDFKTGEFSFSFNLGMSYGKTIVVLPGEWSNGNFTYHISDSSLLTHTMSTPGQSIALGVEQLPYHTLEIQRQGTKFVCDVTVKLWPASHVNLHLITDRRELQI